MGRIANEANETVVLALGTVKTMARTWNAL